MEELVEGLKIERERAILVGWKMDKTEDVDGLGLASAGRALNNVRTQRGGNREA